MTMMRVWGYKYLSSEFVLVKLFQVAQKKNYVSSLQWDV